MGILNFIQIRVEFSIQIFIFQNANSTGLELTTETILIHSQLPVVLTSPNTPAHIVRECRCRLSSEVKCTWRPHSPTTQPREESPARPAVRGVTSTSCVSLAIFLEIFFQKKGKNGLQVQESC